MCHKYRFLGRIDESGKRINYNVSENLYDHTVHRNVSCRECHPYINKIPHDPVKEQVNCANLCHLTTPFSKERFSHERIIEVYKKSAHAPQPGDSAQLKEAKPNCKFCHLNPMYTRVSEERIDYHESLVDASIAIRKKVSPKLTSTSLTACDTKPRDHHKKL